MRPWSETISLRHPLRDVATVSQVLSLTAHERERAAYERGRLEGERSLGEQLIQQRMELLELQNGVLRSLRQTLPQVVAECEHTLVRLAMEVARKLVADLPITAETVAAAVHRALTEVAESTPFSVLLNPEDLALLQQVNAPVLLTTLGAEKIRFESSNEVTRAGCMVRTRFGTVDARREKQFDLLLKSLEAE